MTAHDRLLETAIRELARRHTQHLKALGPIRVLAQDPCPICMGRVIADEHQARCLNCDWTYREKKPAA